MVLLIVAELGVSLLILDGDTWVPAIAALMVDEEEPLVELYAIGLNLLNTHAEGW